MEGDTGRVHFLDEGIGVRSCRLDFSYLVTNTVLIGLLLYLMVCGICWWLLLKRRYVILLLWPVIIYFPGPILTSLFAAAPGLGQYVFPDTTMFETVVILGYFVGMVLADGVFDLSSIIETSLFNPTVRGLTGSPMFLPIYLAAAGLAIVLQINILRTYGSVLTGNYAYWDSLGDAGSLWGFIAGLYEMIFLCFVVVLLGGDGFSRSTRRLIWGVYALAAVLRLAGGTRLVLVKELSLVLILLYLQRRIPQRKLLIAAVLIVVGGSGIGMLRGGGGNVGGLLGPLYGIVIESAFCALSFNIAYQVQIAGAIDTVRQIGQTVSYVLITSVPSFLRPGVTQADLDAISPYNLGLATGFDSISPVGGMSGFATVTYVSGNVAVGCCLLIVALIALLRFTPCSQWKRLAVLVFILNAIHFWRDPLDISIKLVIQDMLIVLLFLYIPRLGQWRMPRLNSLDASI